MTIEEVNELPRAVATMSWGTSEVLVAKPKYIVEELQIKPNERLPLTYNQSVVEYLSLIKGAATLQLEQPDEWDNYNLIDLTMLYFTPIIVRPPLLHRIVAGPNGCVLLKVSSCQK